MTIIKKEYKSKRNKDLLFAQQIARTLKKFSKIDVFKNTRHRQVFHIRSLLIYILRTTQNMPYTTIKDFFIDNGKKYDCATAYNAFNNYKIYKK